MPGKWLCLALAAGFFLLSLIAVDVPLHAKVYIDIDSPGYRPVPVAVVLVPAPDAPDACDQTRAGSVLMDVLQQNLQISGLFRILPPESHLVEPRHLRLHPGPIDFRAWSLIQAEALILLQLACDGEAVLCDAQLLDVLTGKLLTWKRYRSREAGMRRVAHKVANEVEKAMTGIEGVFDTKIAYVSNVTGHKELYVMDFDGHGVRQVARLGSLCVSPAWSPDGRNLAFTSYWQGTPEIYRIDWRVGGEPKPLLRGFSPLTSGAAWSPDGKTIAFSASKEGRANIFLLPDRGGSPEQITRTWALNVSPSWSPDGKQIVFVSSMAGGPDLYIMQADGTGTRRLTFEGVFNADPEWSPTGDWIVFVSREAGRFQVFRIRPDGTQRTQLTHAPCDHFKPTWSPNGRFIAFSSNPDGNFDLFLIRMDGSGRRRLTWGPRDETDPAWSPRLDP